MPQINKKILGPIATYWQVIPGVRAALFKKADPARRDYSALRIPLSELKSAILGHAEFAAFNTTVTRRFKQWRSAALPHLKGFAKDGHPKALIETVAARYPKLTEDEIKTLVVEDKWLGALSTAVQGELDRVSQTLTGRIRQLAERYATPLPDLTGEVELVAAKVAGHLAKMGFKPSNQRKQAFSLITQFLIQVSDMKREAAGTYRITSTVGETVRAFVPLPLPPV